MKKKIFFVFVLSFFTSSKILVMQDGSKSPPYNPDAPFFEDGGNQITDNRKNKTEINFLKIIKNKSGEIQKILEPTLKKLKTDLTEQKIQIQELENKVKTLEKHISIQQISQNRMIIVRKVFSLIFVWEILKSINRFMCAETNYPRILNVLLAFANAIFVYKVYPHKKINYEQENEIKEQN